MDGREHGVSTRSRRLPSTAASYSDAVPWRNVSGACRLVEGGVFEARGREASRSIVPQENLTPVQISAFLLTLQCKTVFVSGMRDSSHEAQVQQI
jgi:hypothetical protein